MSDVEWAAVEELPSWLQTLAVACETLEPEDLSMFLPPDDGSGRASAVLICAGDSPRGPSLLLSQRSADLRKHAGQVAFPGGAVDPVDRDHLAAALREAEEEVGLDPASVVPIAELPAIFIPVTGFIVSPVVAWWRNPHPVAPIDPAEVARVVVAPIAELANPANRFRTMHPSGLFSPGFEVDGLFIWGFTAGLIDRLLTLGGWALPWDKDNERPLPANLLGRRS